MQPLRAKAQERTQIARTASLPAPTAGWYVGDNQATPPPKTAIVMNNAFPQLDYIRPRGGSQLWESDLGAPVSSLLPWVSGLSSKLFAVSSGNIFDVSSQGVAPAASVTGLSSSYLIATQFQGFGGSYLVAVNGVDPVQIFDGTDWNKTYVLAATLASSINVTGLASTTGLQAGMALSGTGIPAGTTIAAVVGPNAITISLAATITGGSTLTFYQNAPITGYTGTAFSFVWSYKGRLYFIDGRTFNVYYLGLVSIGGPATLLPLSAFFKFGGYIMAAATWAVDSTSGAFQAMVFISSEGEVLMYNGDYPGATNWTQLGSYKVSRPLGPNCTMASGGDLLIVTEDGIVAMSQVMTLDQVALENVAATKPIQPAWRNAVLSRTGLLGWQIVSWPLQSMVVINLPKVTSDDFTQYVANSRTGAWCQYLGWDANCFAVFNGNLFYGDSVGNVFQGETGGSDEGVTPYTVSVLLGFSDLGAPTDIKNVRLVRPYVLASSPTNPQVSVSVDYNVNLPTAPAADTAVYGPLWDSGIWDTSVWGGALVNQSSWLDAQGVGSAISICYQIALNSGTSTPDIRISAFDALYEVGGVGLG